MDINYGWVGFALLLMIILIIWIIKRNKKDEKEYEDEIIQSEIKPKKHEDDKV
jgi:hypothetical protein